MTTSKPAPSGARFQSAEVRRRQILDAAARLAVGVGLEKTSIAEVANEAGLAKGSIYLHFDSRSALLAALQADLWARMLTVPEAIVADQTLSSTSKLDAVVDHLMRFEYEHRDLYHAVFHTVASDGDEPFAQASALLAGLLTDGERAGDFDLGGLTLEVVVQFLLHAYAGPCFHHGDPETAIENVQRLFRRTLGASISS